MSATRITSSAGKLVKQWLQATRLVDFPASYRECFSFKKCPRGDSTADTVGSGNCVSIIDLDHGIPVAQALG